MITELHSAGNCSITGGVVIHDPKLPAWKGRYVFGDYCRGVIQTAKLPSEQGHRPQPEGPGPLVVR